MEQIKGPEHEANVLQDR